MKINLVIRNNKKDTACENNHKIKICAILKKQLISESLNNFKSYSFYEKSYKTSLKF